ncbi:cytochrome c oxidase assembly protein [Xanthobacteraceae bacterium A53D]
MEQIPYCGPAPFPETLHLAWNFGILPLALGFAPLMVGLMSRSVNLPRAAFASLGLLIAFVSPLCALTVALFAARGVHHLLLVLAVAPALALAWPYRLPLSGNLGVLGLAAMLVLWHVPDVYSLAWQSPAVYWAMQIGLILSAWAFWSDLFAPDAPGNRLSSALKLFGLAGAMGFIGAILTFSPRLFFLEHFGLTDAFGLSALADQQMAGLVMWVPGMLPLALLGALMLRREWGEIAKA